MLLALLGLALADEPASVLDDIDVAKLEAFAMEHPAVERRRAELRVRRREVNTTRITPIKSFNIGTGLVEGDTPGSGPQLSANIWLSVNVMDLVVYPNRVRIAEANKDAAKEMVEVEERTASLQVLTMVNALRQREAELLLAEASVAALEVQAEAAQKLFLNNQLTLEQLTTVEGQLIGARGWVIQAKGGFQQALDTLENLTGHPLSDARKDAP